MIMCSFLLQYFKEIALASLVPHSRLHGHHVTFFSQHQDSGWNEMSKVDKIPVLHLFSVGIRRGRNFKIALLQKKRRAAAQEFCIQTSPNLSTQIYLNFPHPTQQSSGFGLPLNVSTVFLNLSQLSSLGRRWTQFVSSLSSRSMAPKTTLAPLMPMTAML